MVEFGLKLEDNKVSEWSDKYIDYEKLKTILKRAKSAAEYRDDLAKRVGQAAAEEVVKEREARKLKIIATPASPGSSDDITVARTRTNSRARNLKTALSSSFSMGEKVADRIAAINDTDQVDSSAGDVTAADINQYYAPLKQPPIYHQLELQALDSASKKGSSSSLGAGASDTTPLLKKKSMDRVNSFGHLHHAVKKVASYMGLSDERDNLLRSFDDADEKLDFFKQNYESEVNKVNDFYHDQLNDISERMEALIESVDTSQWKPKKAERRSSNIVNVMKERFEAMRRGSTIEYSMNLQHSISEEIEDDQVTDLEKWNGMRSSTIGDDIGLGNKTEIRSSVLMKQKVDLVRESDSIQRAITDIYRTAKMLHNYTIMNYTGFVKIAKKFDKTFKEHKGMFKKIICEDEKPAELLTARMERLYSKWFCGGDTREAQAQLLSKKGDGLMMDWTQLRLGYRLGMCSILALWVAWDCVWGQFEKGEVSIGGRTAFPVFRGCFGLLAWHWFWGMAVYIWTRYRINYIYLFDFDPRLVDTPIDIFNEAVDETLVFFVCMLMYYKAASNNMPEFVPPGAYPLFLVVYATKCLLFPWKRRKPLWIAIKQVLSSPFVSPTFFLTYVGDVFTSMVKVFQDLLWTACFVVSGDWLLSDAQSADTDNVHMWTQSFWYKNVAIPLICLFPLWLRFNQCLRRYIDTGKRFPNLANAFKYAMSQSVTLFGTFHPLYLMHTQGDEQSISMADDDDQEEDLIIGHSRRSNVFQFFWMGLFIASSLYSFCWDVYMDWGLGRREFGFLGPRLMFPHRSHYYMVMAVDLVLRMMWVLTLIPPQSGAKFELPAYLSAISMTLELFRRTIWSFFRLEHEHRQNTEGYRRVNVVPLHFNTGHKHKYNERHFVGWRVLIEISVVTLIVLGVSAFSVIAAQRATHQVQLSHPSDL